MKNLRGLTMVDAGCQDRRLNVFYSDYNDGTRVIFRQPRKPDSGKLRAARRSISDVNWERFRRLNVDQSLYNLNKRCKLPLYKGECPGILPLTVELDDNIIGFSDIFFNTGEYFSRYKVEPTDKCCNGSIVALDKYQGLGIGTVYASTSNAIGRHFGCQWILGRTYSQDGMRGIRAKENPPWEIVWTDGKIIDHKKRLT
jgi:hypothetical protein